jgi:hypothetical protein
MGGKKISDILPSTISLHRRVQGIVFKRISPLHKEVDELDVPFPLDTSRTFLFCYRFTEKDIRNKAVWYLHSSSSL